MNTFDMTGLNKALQNLGAQTARSRRGLVNEAAKGFVKEVIRITPPASEGVNGAAAKKAGEIAVVGDLGKLAVGVVAAGRGAALASQDELLALHKRSRAANGRVNPRNRREKLLVAQATFQRVAILLQKKVGWLAAGWNAAARHLGVAVPAWIRRHGSSFGEVKLTTNRRSFRLELSNVVRFVGNVRDYARRVQYALNLQGRKTQRQADFLMKKNLKSAGFR